MKLAVIADDFTGGADAASFLKRQNAKIVLVTKIPHEQVECDCLVFALKIRSIPKNKAIESVKQVLSLIHISEPTRLMATSRMPSSA